MIISAYHRENQDSRLQKIMKRITDKRQKQEANELTQRKWHPSLIINYPRFRKFSLKNDKIDKKQKNYFSLTRRGVEEKPCYNFTNGIHSNRQLLRYRQKRGGKLAPEHLQSLTNDIEEHIRKNRECLITRSCFLQHCKTEPDEGYKGTNSCIIRKKRVDIYKKYGKIYCGNKEESEGKRDEQFMPWETTYQQNSLFE